MVENPFKPVAKEADDAQKKSEPAPAPGPQIVRSNFVEGDPDWESKVNEPVTPPAASADPKDQPGYAGKAFNGRWSVEEYERRVANQRSRVTRGRFIQGLDYSRRHDV